MAATPARQPLVLVVEDYADARTAHIPVIALSGQVLPRHADEARRAGCAAVLLKPCAPDALVAEVKRILSAGGRGQRTVNS